MKRQSKKSFMFILQHVHIVNECDDVKMVGVFSSKKEALSAKKKLMKKPGFKSSPSGFYIDRYEIDFIHWDKGFKTV